MTKKALKRLINKKIKESRERINELDNQMHQAIIQYEKENCDFAISFHSGRLDTLKTIAKLLD